MQLVWMVKEMGRLERDNKYILPPFPSLLPGVPGRGSYFSAVPYHRNGSCQASFNSARLASIIGTEPPGESMTIRSAGSATT